MKEFREKDRKYCLNFVVASNNNSNNTIIIDFIHSTGYCNMHTHLRYVWCVYLPHQSQRQPKLLSRNQSLHGVDSELHFLNAVIRSTSSRIRIYFSHPTIASTSTFLSLSPIFFIFSLCMDMQRSFYYDDVEMLLLLMMTMIVVTTIYFIFFLKCWIVSHCITIWSDHYTFTHTRTHKHSKLNARK